MPAPMKHGSLTSFYTGEMVYSLWWSTICMNITQQKYFLRLDTSQTINELEISEQVSNHIKQDSNNRPK